MSSVLHSLCAVEAELCSSSGYWMQKTLQVARSISTGQDISDAVENNSVLHWQSWSTWKVCKSCVAAAIMQESVQGSIVADLIYKDLKTVYVWILHLYKKKNNPFVSMGSTSEVWWRDLAAS